MLTYFDYLFEKVERNSYGSVVDERICSTLHSIIFDSDIVDDTRIEDIQAAREDYFNLVECRPEWDSAIFEGDEEFSVFELLVTLAEKLESKLMRNPIYGDRTPVWFWSMLENLDITTDTVIKEDGNIDSDYIMSVICRWLYKEFQYNGDGSPFPLKNPSEDTRLCSIWRHAMYYLNENYEGKW